MSDWPLLSLVTFLPLLGAAIILVIRGDDEVVIRNARSVALWTSGVTFLLSLFLVAGFDPAQPGFQFVERAQWLPGLGVEYHMGIDGISLWFIPLSALLTILVVLGSWYSVEHRVKEYMVAFLVMDSLMIGVFCALDMVLFYVFFEAILIPMYLIIGIWGGPRRIYASFKFFLYTLAGSVLFLIAILAIFLQTGTTDLAILQNAEIPSSMQYWLWIAMFAAFAVKVPMWPFHTWLPDAHVEAPTGGSVLLAGVLLKLGGYGFLRFSVPMLPEASAYFAPFVFTLSAIAVVYTSLVALVQQDMKKLIAYSSVAHMGLVTIGCFTPNALGIQGSVVQMLSHGVVSAALFMVVGVVYDRIHSREISRYGGLADRMPFYAVIFLFFSMASVGLPGTSGFVGEVMVIVGVFQVNSWVAALAATGMILGAAYMLWLYRRVIFGTITRDDLKSIKDLRWNEIVAFAPLVFLTLWLGIYPVFFTRPMEPAVAQLIQQTQTVDTAAVADE
ncbi:MAG TPA: NADH-quinone oxidoreductase subunit M [Geminicoccus sp.]|uniref:NADH-quinone oxidoreductase subunit M n=1 Tax=Geminicoccus sp. TaxID=2024832 RepID=UPI002CC67E5A|nr:NADH-quinone oxidoreductase subunit M [Geminicoccus sp.]HWL70184.1 NADH-quinone oxidoreductase subunit M [Geminicoccus sp.]